MADSLRDLLGSGDKRREVIDDACRVLDLEVADKGGLGGVAVKGAYKIVKGIKPGFVPDVVDHLLDDFLDALDPLYREALASDQRPGAFLESNRGRMADSLLAVTDARAERAKTKVLKKTYDKLRPAAKKHVEQAAPRLGGMLDRHAPRP